MAAGQPAHRRSQQHTPPKPSTGNIVLGQRAASGYRNPTNDPPRILLHTSDLAASTHPQP